MDHPNSPKTSNQSIFSPLRWIFATFGVLKYFTRTCIRFFGGFLPWNMGLPFRSRPMLSGVEETELFQRKFEDKFGSEHPRFFSGSYRQAIEQSRSEYKLLLVYLHSERHQSTNVFCRETLCNSVLADFINDNLVFWAASVNDSSDGHRIAAMLSVESYPAIAVLRVLDETTTVIHISHGHMSSDEMYSRLATLIDSQSQYFNSAKNANQERERSRQLREEQDAEFQMALEADRQRDRAAREAQQREEERIRLEKEEELRKKAELERKRRSLPEEPSSSEPSIHIMIKLPTGVRLSRKFSPANTVQSVYDFLDVSQCELEPESYQLVSNFPTRTHSEKKLTLSEASLSSQTVLLVDLL
eukprot:TRINITY_DN1606_c1_g1_i1.p1 TRINITY_DN1606_c1_g1~~TRINITY_DN1606_c1_g1_i1.p1  ORF type:complete len:396 (-),score=111.20 TRINITY_DN1606_c1_g1_i1:97-1170(-)